MNDGFQWVDFYKEFADKLLTYKNNRTELIEKVKAIYENIGLPLPTLEKDNQLVDIDPFTVFGLFNKGKLGDKRTKIVDEIRRLFDVKTETPVSFNGLPVLSNSNAVFYNFVGERDDEDFNYLWKLFEAALSYAADRTRDSLQNVSKYFELVVKMKYNGSAFVSMGLFWIAPHAFLSLDKRNVWYIYKSGYIPKSVVSSLPKIEKKIAADNYWKIVKILNDYLQSGVSKLKDFKDLSFAAWNCYNEEVKKEKKAKKGDKLADKDVRPRYWLYAPGEGAEMWDKFREQGVMGLGWHELGNLSDFKSKGEMKAAMEAKIDPDKNHASSAHATWQFVHDMRPDDIVFVKKGVQLLVGRGVVTSEYNYDRSVDEHYPNLRNVRWTHKGEWKLSDSTVQKKSFAQKTLTDITSADYVGQLNALFNDDEAYSSKNFLDEVYIKEDDYYTLVELLDRKKNIILQGAPGVGKTFTAKRLAYSMMDVKDQNRVMMVQFHQSYTYEDFVEGFRPAGGNAGFEIKKGPFYRFCTEAKGHSENKYFFIIDEINRGNLSKIFGELFMLIENDKRGTPLQLMYSDEKFSVPKNVYIIGTMNTADRSLAMLDYALRRRFAFFEMTPGFETDGFKKEKDRLSSEKFNRLIDCVKELNKEIAKDDSLGEGFCVGHSYFCNLKEASEKTLANIVKYEIVPLLNEYWYDEPGKAKEWAEKLRSAINNTGSASK